MRNVVVNKPVQVKPLTSNPQVRSKLVNIALPEILIARCQGLITSQKTAGKFELASVSDLIRKSLTAHQKGLALVGSRLVQSGRKKVSVILTPDLLTYYYSLPAGNRWEIVERSLLAYLEQKI